MKRTSSSYVDNELPDPEKDVVRQWKEAERLAKLAKITQYTPPPPSRPKKKSLAGTTKWVIPPEKEAVKIDEGDYVLYNLTEFLERTRGTINLPIIHILNSLPFALDIDDGPWLAGGSIRRAMMAEDQEQHDFDIFTKNSGQAQNCTDEMREAKAKQVDWFGESKGIGNYEWKDHIIQLINFNHEPTAVDLIANFSYTVCQFVTDGDVLIMSKWAMMDVYRKILRKVPQASQVPTEKMRVKYLKKGFIEDLSGESI